MGCFIVPDNTGTGTVTNFTAGNLPPIFTTSVANPTTAPALSFSLTNQSANQVFAGPASGAAAAPTFRALVPFDLPDPTVLTVAAAQALALVSGFKPGHLYEIFDAASNTAPGLQLVAYSSNTLYRMGQGPFQGAAMAASILGCTIWYDLTTDAIYQLYAPEQQVLVTQGTNNPLSQLPLETGAITRSEIYDSFFNIGFGGTVTLTNSLMRGCFVDTGIGSPVSFISSVCENVSFQMAGGSNAIKGCTITGDSQGLALITMNDTSLDGCTILDKSMDFGSWPAYNAIGKFYGGYVSTFEVTGINPNSLGNMDISPAAWGGIFYVTDASFAVNSFPINGYPLDHEWEVRNADAGSMHVQDKDVAAGNIMLPVAGSSQTLVTANSDFIRFRAAFSDPTNFVQSIIIYVRT